MSSEFKDLVAKMLRGLGFEVHQRISVPIASRVYYELDQLCLSNELAMNDDDSFKSRVIWVETKLRSNGGHVRKEVLLKLLGAFTCLFYKEFDESNGPDAIWVVTNGNFSHSAKNLAKALNEGLGREFFVLVDGNKLKGLISAQVRTPIGSRTK